MAGRQPPATAEERARNAPRSARPPRKVDPFFVLLGTAFLLVGFFVTRGMATPTTIPKVPASTAADDTRVQPAATLSPAPIEPTAAPTIDPAFNTNASSARSGFAGTTVSVDPRFASQIQKTMDANAQVASGGTTTPVDIPTTDPHHMVDVGGATSPLDVAASSGSSAANPSSVDVALEQQRAAIERDVAALQGASSQSAPPGAEAAAGAPSSAPSDPPHADDVIPGGFHNPAPYELPAGWAIPVVGRFAVDSDLSGDVVATVARNVCDPVNDAVVVPEGAWLNGRYVGLGSHRHLLFMWYRLTQPDLTYRNLSDVATLDEEGHMGVGGRIASQRWQYFRDTVVGSIANAAGTIINNALSRSANVTVGSSAAAYSPTEDVPSVTMGNATPFNVFLEADYTVPTPYHGEYCH